MKRSPYLLSLLAIALIPSTASANAGTPLMWASMLHLVFGNAILGLIEGLLLAWIFKCPRAKSILILIGANYASAWAGGFFVVRYLASLPDITIQSIQIWFLAFVGIAFLVTLLIEFPFFWSVLCSKERPFRQALKATALVHSISYALLFGWYWMASGTAMMTQLEVVSASVLIPKDHYSLYYLSPKGDQVLRRDLGNNGIPEVVSKVSAPHRDDRLFVRTRGDSDFDLFLRLDSNEHGNGKEDLIIASFAEKAAVEWRIAEGRAENAEGTWFNSGPVPTLAEKSDWEFRTGFWPIEGINGEQRGTRRRIRFSLETPFAAWNTRNATHLQGDYLVFQLGDDQICMLHPESRKIVLIARGKGPIVAKPKVSNMPRR